MSIDGVGDAAFAMGRRGGGWMMLAAILRRAGDLRSFKMSLVDDVSVVESSGKRTQSIWVSWPYARYLSLRSYLFLFRRIVTLTNISYLLCSLHSLLHQK
jgi:hypothetical protein